MSELTEARLGILLGEELRSLLDFGGMLFLQFNMWPVEPPAYGKDKELLLELLEFRVRILFVRPRIFFDSALSHRSLA